MPIETRGSVYKTRAGYGIRWPENGGRGHRSGFNTKTEARKWFADNVAPRLGSGAPSAEITFDAFCDLYLERHGATVSKRTRETIDERLAPARRSSAVGRCASSSAHPTTSPPGGRACPLRRATG